VISLGEPCSEATAVPQLSSVAVNDAAVDESLHLPSHRVTVNRCGSPPTGRSVSFMCGQADEGTRASCRRQSEQKDVAFVPTVAVTSSPCAIHHIEDEKFCRLESSHADTMSPSDVRVCYCVSSPPSAEPPSDFDGCLC